MKNITRWNSRSFTHVFGIKGYRLIGGTTGPHTTQREAIEALRQRRALQTRELRAPHAEFVLYREEVESDPTDDEWLQIAKRVMARIGAADAMWWAFVGYGGAGRFALHIFALLFDFTGKAVATRRYQWGSLNADGSRRERVPKELWLAMKARGGAH